VVGELNDLTDVTILGTPEDGQSLAYTGGQWINNNSSNITSEPSGFTDPENVTVSYNSTTRQITLTGTVNAYYKGFKIPELTSGWVSDAVPAGPTAPYYLYYDGSSFVWSTSAWSFNQVQIAFVAYDSGGTFYFALREPHGLMAWETHRELHHTVGTYVGSGGGLTNYVLNSTTAADRRPDVVAIVLYDEDLPTTNAALTTNSYTQFYLSGAGGDLNFDLAQADIVPLSGSRPYWNEWTGSTWQQTLVDNNDYMSVWLMGLPATSDATSQEYRYVWVQGQSESQTLLAQQALSPQDITLSTFDGISPEFIFFKQIIIRYSGGNWTIVDVRDISGDRFSQTSSPSGQYLTTVNAGFGLTGLGTSDVPLVATNVTGPQGETGAQGIQGLQGVQGETGVQGLDGSEGPQGETGAQGLQGETGVQGIQGDQGDTGAQGTSGSSPAGQIYLSSAGGWPSTTNGAEGPVLTEYTTNDIDMYTLNFDQSTDEYAQWSLAMPSDWDAGTVTATFYWSAGGGTGNVVWGLQGRTYGNGVSLDSAWGTAQTVTDTRGANDTLYITGSTSAITLTGAGSSELAQFRCYRDANSGSDTLTADARLHGIMITFTRS
jgi:hypothetical protein